MIDTCGENASEWEPTVHLRWNVDGELEQQWERDIYQPCRDFDGKVIELLETELTWRLVERYKK